MPAELRTVRTAGTTGSGLELENNVYVLGDAAECVIVDASWDVAPVLDAVGSRMVRAIVITHGHGDHVNIAEELRAATGAPVLMHPADQELWAGVNSTTVDGPLEDGQVLNVAGVSLYVVHTPGHTPGACCLDVPALGVLLTGDTLFPGGPGKTGSAPSFAQIMASVERVFALPDDRTVLPGHGDATTLGAERPHLGEWRARGW